jgi:hypothetical protein
MDLRREVLGGTPAAHFGWVPVRCCVLKRFDDGRVAKHDQFMLTDHDCGSQNNCPVFVLLRQVSGVVFVADSSEACTSAVVENNFFLQRRRHGTLSVPQVVVGDYKLSVHRRHFM